MAAPPLGWLASHWATATLLRQPTTSDHMAGAEVDHGGHPWLDSCHSPVQFLYPLSADVTVEGHVLESPPGALKNPRALHSTLRVRILHRGRGDHHQTVSVVLTVHLHKAAIGVEGYRRCRSALGHKLGHARGPDLLDVLNNTQSAPGPGSVLQAPIRRKFEDPA